MGESLAQVKPIGLEHRCGTGIPGFDLAAAVEWEVSKGLRLRPVLRYQFGSDPRDSNAQLATVGIAFDYGGRTRLPIHYVFADSDGDGIADGDLDGDGMRELAIGAPWAAQGALTRVGRVEIRSLRGVGFVAKLHGTIADGWLGWHIARAGAALPGPGMVVGILRSDHAAGAPELHAFADRHPVISGRVTAASSYR